MATSANTVEKIQQFSYNTGNNTTVFSTDLRVQGNLTVVGGHVVAQTSTLIVQDNIITLNAFIGQSQTPVSSAGIEIDRGNQPNVSLMWIESEGAWKFTSDGITYDVLGGGSAGAYANGAFEKANSAGLYANGAFVKVNAVYQYANSTSLWGMRQAFIATAGQTTFSPGSGYVPGQVDVFYNGIKLYGTEDFTATDGVNVILTNPAGANAIVEVVGFGGNIAASNVYVLNSMASLLNRQTFIVPVHGQTVFTPSTPYRAGYVDVYYNGLKMVIPDDVVANNGTHIYFVGLTPTTNDVIEIVGLTPNVALANAIPITGGTVSGGLTLAGNVLPETTNTYYLGSETKRWHSLYVGPGSIDIGGLKLSNVGGTLSVSTPGAPATPIAGEDTWVRAQANAAFNAANSVNVYGANTSSNAFFSIPQGTTAQRPASAQLGSLRYNTTLGLAEIYTLNGWTTITGSVPTISNVTPASYAGNTGAAFTIFGTGFQSDASVRFITANGYEYIAATVVYGNTTTLQATTPKVFTVAEGPLDVKVIQANGTASVTKFDTIQTGTSPTWNTASGTLTTIYEDASGTHTTLDAYDPESSVTYSIVSGSLPSGLSLVSANGAIVGNTSGVSSQTTSTFTVAATDAANNQTTRSFSIVVNPLASGGTITTFVSGANTWRIHAFTSNSNFVANKTLTADIFLVGGGGAGGYGLGDQDTGKGGGGAGGVLWGQNKTITAGSYAMSIGQGGNYRPNGTGGTPPAGEKGNNTTAFSVTAFGGGAGGQSDNQNWGTNNTGGSGGGAGARNTNGTTGWSSTQTAPAGWTAYGNAGGSSSNDNSGGGGGGGAGAVGTNASGPANNSAGGPGGVGIDMSAYFGTTYGVSGWFAGGGGGGSYSTSTLLSQSPGGQGGGGAGVSAKESSSNPSPQYYASNINGLPNTGGGGGGASEDGQDSSGNQAGGGSSSGGGGSGIILVRYLIRS